MTLQEFQNKYLGKQVEYHSYGAGAQNQCTDLVNQYIKEVLGLTPIIGANAKDFPTRFDKNEFDWIVNTPEAIVQEGDIPIWNGNVGGGAGHIAIARKGANINTFPSLDQNWSQVERVTLENHNYNNVLGWLRPKTQGGDSDMANMYKGYDLANPDSMKVAVDVLVRVQAGEFVDKPKYDEALSKIKELESRPTTASNPKAEALLKAVKEAVS